MYDDDRKSWNRERMETSERANVRACERTIERRREQSRKLRIQRKVWTVPRKNQTQRTNLQMLRGVTQQCPYVEHHRCSFEPTVTDLQPTRLPACSLAGYSFFWESPSFSKDRSLLRKLSVFGEICTSFCFEYDKIRCRLPKRNGTTSR